MSNTEEINSEPVVIQFGSRTLKGYLESPVCNTIEELLSNAPPSSPETFRVRHLDSDIVEEIPTNRIKAVFYVNSFEGDSEFSLHGARHPRDLDASSVSRRRSDGGNRLQLSSLSFRARLLSVANRPRQQQQIGVCHEELACGPPGSGNAQSLILQL